MFKRKITYIDIADKCPPQADFATPRQSCRISSAMHTILVRSLLFDRIPCLVARGPCLERRERGQRSDRPLSLPPSLSLENLRQVLQAQPPLLLIACLQVYEQRFLQVELRFCRMFMSFGAIYRTYIKQASWGCVIIMMVYTDRPDKTALPP